MASESVKKQRERFLFERFAEISGITVEVIDAENESPDLLVRIENDLVGIEITELFVVDGKNGNTPQAKEAIAGKIVRKAQELFEAEGPPYVHASIHFSPNSDLHKLNRDRTAKQLAEFVRKQTLPEQSHLAWEQDYESGELPEEISFVNMLPVPSKEYAHWNAPGAGWVAPVTQKMLQERIDAKSSRLRHYESRVTTNWLLIVGDGHSASRLVKPMPEHSIEGLQSPFSKTFYFGYMSRQVIELQTLPLGMT